MIWLRSQTKRVHTHTLTVFFLDVHHSARSIFRGDQITQARKKRIGAQQDVWQHPQKKKRMRETDISASRETVSKRSTLSFREHTPKIRRKYEHEHTRRKIWAFNLISLWLSRLLRIEVVLLVCCIRIVWFRCMLSFEKGFEAFCCVVLVSLCFSRIRTLHHFGIT